MLHVLVACLEGKSACGEWLACDACVMLGHEHSDVMMYNLFSILCQCL